MYDSVIKLVAETFVKDEETGLISATLTERKVYAEINSISRAEFESAGVQGLTPEYRFRLPKSSYNGERIALYNGVSYAIYRTYERKGDIELYVQRQTGVANG